MGTEKDINIYYQNVRGLNTKIDEFSENVLICQYDVIVLTETWLHEGVYSSELFHAKYNVYRCDRRGTKRGGGVLVAIKEGYESKHISVNCETEALVVKLNFNNRFYYIVAPYFAPSSNVKTYRSLNKIFEQRPDFQNCKLIIIGDFNLPLITDSSYRLNMGGMCYKELLNFLNLFNLRSINDIRNSLGRTLDLILTNAQENIVVHKEEFPLVKEDNHHPALVLQLNIKSKVRKCNIKSVYNERNNFKKANFDQLYRMFRDIDWTDLNNVCDVDEAVDMFYDRINAVLSQTVPKMKHKPSNKYPCWFNKQIIDTLKKKEFHRKRMKCNETSESLFKEYRKKLKVLINRAYCNYVREIQDKVKSSPQFF